MSSEPDDVQTHPAPPSLPPPQPPGAYAPPARPDVKQPVVALVLSLFPGLGQMYNGHKAKGVGLFGAWVGCLYAIVEGHPLPFALILPFVYFYNLIDAYRSAVLINARASGWDESYHARASGWDESYHEPEAEPLTWGLGLVVLGVVLLLHNFGILNLADFLRLWPLVLVALGGMFIFGSLRRRRGATTEEGTGEADSTS